MKQGFLTRPICTALSLLLCFFALFVPAAAENETAPSSSNVVAASNMALSLDCKSAVLMDASTGTVLYSQNAEQALPPASVTKIMTLLLVMEAIDAGRIRLDDTVTVSSNAASMGGSQIYLEPGEAMSVEDLIKSVVISSANDAAVALAEYVCGDADTFVQQMNEKAKQLGMNSTHFQNVTGLDDTATDHLTSALDIALMSRALIAHPLILKYSSIWMDTVRGGAFGLSNTNRLVRFYKGATGLKTGSTSKAGFCVSATAQRDGLSLICVIMGAQSSDIRNAQATKLLDWGFANYTLFCDTREEIGELRVLGGVKAYCKVEARPFSYVLSKNDAARVQHTIQMPENLKAPIKSGQVVGSVEYTLDGTVIGCSDIVATEDVNKIDFWSVWLRLLAKMVLK